MFGAIEQPVNRFGSTMTRMTELAFAVSALS